MIDYLNRKCTIVRQWYSASKYDTLTDHIHHTWCSETICLSKRFIKFGKKKVCRVISRQICWDVLMKINDESEKKHIIGGGYVDVNKSNISSRKWKYSVGFFEFHIKYYVKKHSYWYLSRNFEMQKVRMCCV